MLKKQNKKQASSSLFFKNCLTFHCTYCLLTVDSLPFSPDWWSGEERALNCTFWSWGPLPLLDTRIKALAEQPFLFCDLCFVGKDVIEPREVLWGPDLCSELKNWTVSCKSVAAQKLTWVNMCCCCIRNAGPTTTGWECLKENDSSKHLLFVAAPLAQSPAVAEAYPVMLAMCMVRPVFNEGKKKKKSQANYFANIW